MKRPASALTKLLGVALVIVAVLPLLIFATDFTNSQVLRSARKAATQRSSNRPAEESEDAMRERIRIRRAKMHPVVPSVALAMTFQLVMLSAIAFVGRRLFALRL